MEIEEGLLPVNIEARGAGVEIRRLRPDKKRKVDIDVRVEARTDSGNQ